MSNPFIDGMDDRLRGRYVRAVSNQGRVYRGWVERIHHHERHLMLRDATLVDEDETDVGSTLVTRATEVAVLEDDSRIERVDLDEIEAAPYHEREFQESANRGYVADVRDTGFVGSFPVVRERGDGYEVVEGHKRIWACRQAGIETHPVEIVDVSDWAAACRFAADHYPDPGQVDGDGAVGSGCYEADDLEASIETLVDRWGERALELDRVRFNAERLDLDVAGAGGADPTADVDESDQEDGAEDVVDEPIEPSEPEVVPIEDLAEDISGLGDIGVENLEAAGFETTADLEDATKGDLRDVGRIGTKIANQLLLEVAEKAYECPECDREFPTSRGREKHVSDTHGESLQDDSADDGAEVDDQEESDAGDEDDEPAEPEDLDTGDDIPANQQAFVLEWGRWGPPHGGTYHVDEDCFALDRSDSDREAVPLPKSRNELEDDEDWVACGHCSDTTSDDIDEEAEPDAGDATEPVDEESGQEDVDDVEDDEPDGARVRQEDAGGTPESRPLELVNETGQPDYASFTEYPGDMDGYLLGNNMGSAADYTAHNTLVNNFPNADAGYYGAAIDTEHFDVDADGTSDSDTVELRYTFALLTVNDAMAKDTDWFEGVTNDDVTAGNSVLAMEGDGEYPSVTDHGAGSPASKYYPAYHAMADDHPAVVTTSAQFAVSVENQPSENSGDGDTNANAT